MDFDARRARRLRRVDRRSTTFLDFPREAKCHAAADALDAADQLSLPNRSNHPNISPLATTSDIAWSGDRGASLRANVAPQAGGPYGYR